MASPGATSFLVMVNANKFVIIGIEAFGMHTKAKRESDRSKTLTKKVMMGLQIAKRGQTMYPKPRVVRYLSAPRPAAPCLIQLSRHVSGHAHVKPPSALRGVSHQSSLEGAGGTS